MQNGFNQIFIGVVEDRADPLQVGRVKVRVVGMHHYDKTILPIDDLPWALVLQPASGGVTASAVGPAEGSVVLVVYEDYPDCQHPIVLGLLVGVPQGQTVNIDKFEESAIWKDHMTPQGRPLPTNQEQATGNVPAGPLPPPPPPAPPQAPNVPNPNQANPTNQTQLPIPPKMP